ncbi:MAG: MFS transporter, partial [Thermoleophilia bacterium]|nr:MFS transporter [Thermoleophilia bacterium]
MTNQAHIPGRRWRPLLLAGPFFDPGARVNRTHVLLVNSMAMWLTAFMTTSINVALPTIQGEFSLGPVALGWLPLAYLLSTAAFLVPFGRLADLHGRRKIFLLGLIIYAFSTLAFAFSPIYALLVTFRASQGLGAAMIFAGSTAMVILAYPPEQRGRAMGINVAAAYLGQTMGPAVGGIVTHTLGWRGLFMLAAGYAFINLFLDFALLRHAEWREEGEHGFDWRGSLIYTLSLGAFLFGLSSLPESLGIA